MGKQVLSAVCLCGLLLTACSAKPTEPEQYQIAVICKSEDPYWDAVKIAVADADSEFDNLSVTYSAPKTEDTEQQKQLIEKAVNDKADVIILAPVSATELDSTLSSAVSNGIHIITIDSDVEFAGRAMCLSTKNEDAAGIAGQYLLEHAEEGSEIAVLTHDVNVTTAQQRTEGFMNAFPEDTSLILDEPIDCKGDTELAEQTAEQILMENKKISYIYTTNQPTTLGACQAVERMSKAGAIKDVAVVGFDFFDGAEKYLEEGILFGVVIQNPYNMGYLAVRYADDLLSGNPIPEVLDTGALLVTKENLNDADVQFVINPNSDRT